MKQLDEFLNGLKEVFGDKLLSVFIYGSALNCDELSNNINLMVIADELSGDDLNKCSKFVRKFTNLKNPPPVFVTQSEWECSSDVYAMEYSDIKDKYKIIYGKDCIKNLAIKREDLRFQCELETKNLLMRLRGFYLSCNCSKSKLKESFIPSTKTLMTIFRSILRLNYTEVPDSDKQVIISACQQSGASEQIFLTLLNNKTGEKKIKNADVDKIYCKLFNKIPELLKYVNLL